MMVVPIQTAEELETGTFGALRLAATGPEILAAKALAGYVYGAAGVGLTVVLTGLDVHDPLLFFGAAFALIVSLVGFGLLLGLLVPNANAINTYAGVPARAVRRPGRRRVLRSTPGSSARSSTSCRSARRPSCSPTASPGSRRSTPGRSPGS